MHLHEYQSKGIFARHGIPVPEGEVAQSPEEARQIAQRLGGKVAVKAQVLVGGRGRAGGIRLAAGPAEAEAVAKDILGMTIGGFAVRRALIERAAAIAQELYFGLTLDRAARHVVAMASGEGGVEIEEIAHNAPEKIVKIELDPFLGLLDYQGRSLAFGIGLDGDLVRDFAAIAQRLYRAFTESDASLAEINPLVLTQTGKLIALDAKMVLDDNALFRQRHLARLRDLEAEDQYERVARENGLSYVRLEGEIGCMVNGAGLAMTTMDVIELHGGEPANFLDIGGGAQAERVAAGLDIVLSDWRVKVVLVNIFGGITRCDEVATGILKALGEVKMGVPIVVRLVGTNAQEGRALLAGDDIYIAESLAEAAKLAVKLAKEA